MPEMPIPQVNDDDEYGLLPTPIQMRYTATVRMALRRGEAAADRQRDRAEAE